MRYTPPQNVSDRDIQDGARLEIDRFEYTISRPFGLPKRITGDDSIKYGQIALCDPSAAGLTITLPPLEKIITGQMIVVKNNSDSTNTITILPAGDDTIDGEASLALATARSKALLFAGMDGWIEL